MASSPAGSHGFTAIIAYNVVGESHMIPDDAKSSRSNMGNPVAMPTQVMNHYSEERNTI